MSPSSSKKPERRKTIGQATTPKAIELDTRDAVIKKVHVWVTAIQAKFQAKYKDFKLEQFEELFGSKSLSAVTGKAVGVSGKTVYHALNKVEKSNQEWDGSDSEVITSDILDDERSSKRKREEIESDEDEDLDIDIPSCDDDPDGEFLPPRRSTKSSSKASKSKSESKSSSNARSQRKVAPQTEPPIPQQQQSKVTVEPKSIYPLISESSGVRTSTATKAAPPGLPVVNVPVTPGELNQSLKILPIKKKDGKRAFVLIRLQEPRNETHSKK